jgi:DNA-binding NarL/FixJ family response regulator
VWPKLNKRESQVAELLIQGAENEDIGRSLGIAQRTVKLHLRRMFDKCGVNDSDKIKRVCLAVALYREQQQAKERNPRN